jgi:hypothetical protein
MEVEQAMISVLQHLFSAAVDIRQGKLEGTIPSDELAEIECLFRHIADQMPLSCHVQCCYGMLLVLMGRHSEALPIYSRAVNASLRINRTSADSGRRMVVLLHNNNDLDHIAPVIYKWSISSQGPVFVVWSPDFPDHKNCELLLSYLNSLPRVQMYTPDPSMILMISWTRELRKIGILGQEHLGLSLVSALLAHFIPSSEDGVLVTDPFVLPLTRELCESARFRGIKCVALPHGETVVYSRKVLKNDTSITFEAIDHVENKASSAESVDRGQ